MLEIWWKKLLVIFFVETRLYLPAQAEKKPRKSWDMNYWLIAGW